MTTAKSLSSGQIFVGGIICLLALLMVYFCYVVQSEDPECNELKDCKYSVFLFLGMAIVWILSCNGKITSDGSAKNN